MYSENRKNKSNVFLSSNYICDYRHFLIRQYRAQLKRRAQQVQEELVSIITVLYYFGINTSCFDTIFECSHANQEADRKILAALVECEGNDRRLKTERRERAIADAAWMKHVIEEQLQLEREREAELDYLHR